MRTNPFTASSFLLAALCLSLPFASLKAAENHEIDPMHSTVLLKVKHLGASTAWGRINTLSGYVQLDPADAAKSKVSLTAYVNSLDTNNQKRDAHLKGPDFFNAQQFPEVTFNSTAVTKKDDTHYEVTGNFTVLGVTKPVTTTVEVVGSGKNRQGETVTGFDTSFTIKRSDFGMNFMVGPLGDDVTIMVSLETVKRG